MANAYIGRGLGLRRLSPKWTRLRGDAGRISSAPRDCLVCPRLRLLDGTHRGAHFHGVPTRRCIDRCGADSADTALYSPTDSDSPVEKPAKCVWTRPGGWLSSSVSARRADNDMADISNATRGHHKATTPNRGGAPADKPTMAMALRESVEAADVGGTGRGEKEFGKATGRTGFRGSGNHLRRRLMHDNWCYRALCC